MFNMAQFHQEQRIYIGFTPLRLGYVRLGLRRYHCHVGDE